MGGCHGVSTTTGGGANNRYCVKTLTGHAEWVREVVPSEDGRWLVSASNDQTARVWDFASGETKAELRGHEHVVECATFAPQAAYGPIRELTGLQAAPGERSKAPGAFVATGSRDKTIRLWDAVSGQCLRVLVSDLETLADGRMDTTTGCARWSSTQVGSTCSLRRMTRP